MKRGHGEALPASPWPINRWNDGTDRSTLPIHGKSVIDQPIALSEFLGDSSQDFFGLGLLS